MPSETRAPEARALPSTTRSLPFALIRARETVMAPIREMLAESGLTEQQWRLLRVLSEFGPQDISEASERSYLLMPSLTRMIRTLDEKGFLTRAQHKADRRRHTLSITPSGQKIIDDNRERGTAIVDSFKAKLGAAEYERLLDLLASLEPGD